MNAKRATSIEINGVAWDNTTHNLPTAPTVIGLLGHPHRGQSIREVVALVTKDQEVIVDGTGPFPEQTVLLPNYPNPFNPETWIPFELSKDADVTLIIYDTTGRVVRTIEVGHTPAGVYESKDKAIYWDGRNDAREQVASGIYFYTLTTNNFIATRKMSLTK